MREARVDRTRLVTIPPHTSDSLRQFLLSDLPQQGIPTYEPLDCPLAGLGVACQGVRPDVCFVLLKEAMKGGVAVVLEIILM